MLLILLYSCICLRNDNAVFNEDKLDDLELFDNNSGNKKTLSCNVNLYLYLQYSNIEIECYNPKVELQLKYNDISNYKFIAGKSVYLNITESDMNILNENIESIANSIRFNSTKNVIFIGGGFDNLGNMTTYAKLFHEDDIELWIVAANDCIWCEKSNLTTFWESKIKNTKWRKMYKGSKSLLHYSIDDGEVGRINYITKKSLIVIIVVVVLVSLAIIVSLFIIGYYCHSKLRVSQE